MATRLSIRWIVLGALFPLAASPRAHETSPKDVRLEAMKKLDLFVGDWKGSGWTATGPDQRFEFRQVERVERKVGGSVFEVEGRSTRKNDAGEEVVMHDGLALLYFDERSGRYLWHGHDGSFGALDADVTRIDGGFEWSFKSDERGATIRFTIRFDEKQWREVGEASADGKAWSKFMETTLERQAPVGAGR